MSRPRGRELDLAIAAHAISLDAALWTLNPADFDDILGLETVARSPRQGMAAPSPVD